MQKLIFLRIGLVLNLLEDAVGRLARYDMIYHILYKKSPCLLEFHGSKNMQPFIKHNGQQKQEKTDSVQIFHEFVKIVFSSDETVTYEKGKILFHFNLKVIHSISGKNKQNSF